MIDGAVVAIDPATGTLRAGAWDTVSPVLARNMAMHSALSNPLDSQAEFSGYWDRWESSSGPPLCPETSYSAECVRVPRLEMAYECSHNFAALPP